MPDYVKGAINLRGKIIPVMDLGLRFGFAAAASAEQNCTVVIQIKNPGGQVTAMGLGVDGVEEVAQIAASEIEEAPDFGAQIYTECVLGMAKLKSGVKTLLDIDQIISGEKVARLAATAVLPEAS